MEVCLWANRHKLLHLMVSLYTTTISRKTLKPLRSSFDKHQGGVHCACSPLDTNIRVAFLGRVLGF